MSILFPDKTEKQAKRKARMLTEHEQAAYEKLREWTGRERPLALILYMLTAEEMPDASWDVPSFSEPGESHRLTLNPPFCECARFSYAHTCSHLEAVSRRIQFCAGKTQSLILCDACTNKDCSLCSGCQCDNPWHAD